MQRVECSQVSNGIFFAGEMFKRAFRDDLPSWGHHLVCFYQVSPEQFIPLTYVNFTQYEDVILVGGAVTNGRAFQHVDAETSQALRQSGGSYYTLLKFGFAQFGNSCDGFFGHAGDRRAYEVDIMAGFEPTEHQYLIVHFHKTLTDSRKAELIGKVHTLGPF
jgi:hypothetical protein